MNQHPPIWREGQSFRPLPDFGISLRIWYPSNPRKRLDARRKANKVARKSRRENRK